jgi:small subunit ribosomal protein S8
MVNDTISDFLTKIRNAINSKHQIVEVLYTKMIIDIVKILKEEGFIENYQISKGLIQNSIIISLKYSVPNRNSIINNLKRISKPGIRVYVRKKNIKNVLGNIGISIISTSQGIMTDRKAKTLNIGGELLCQIS